MGLGLELGRLEFYFKQEDPWGEEASLRLDGEEQTQWRFSLQRLGTDHWVGEGILKWCISIFSTFFPFFFSSGVRG